MFRKCLTDSLKKIKQPKPRKRFKSPKLEEIPEKNPKPFNIPSQMTLSPELVSESGAALTSVPMFPVEIAQPETPAVTNDRIPNRNFNTNITSSSFLNNSLKSLNFPRYIQSDVYYPRLLRPKFSKPIFFEVHSNLDYPRVLVLKPTPPKYRG